MLNPTAYGLAILLNLFLVYMGSRFLMQPRPSAAGYGVAVAPDGDTTYLTVKGLRELVYGLVGLALTAFTTADAVAWFMLVVALNPLGDTLIVLRHGGTKAVAFGIHFATAVVVLLDAALLFAV
jgi:hypothetical protein